MKKLVMILVMVFAVTFGVSAGDTYAHDASVLPKAAQTVIRNNCKGKVSVVKIEKTLGYITEYEVVLTDGTEISFDRDGNWSDVETANSKSVPSGFVPTAISNFVKKNHAGTRIVGIEKERSGYEIELSNGIDIKFDKKGAFTRYDK